MSMERIGAQTICESDMDEFYQCDICEAVFLEICHLKSHITSVHEEEKSFTCAFCNKKFSKKAQLNFHTTKVHKVKSQLKENYTKQSKPKIKKVFLYYKSTIYDSNSKRELVSKGRDMTKVHFAKCFV